MNITGFYAVLMSRDVAAADRFYREVLGALPTFESDWYVSLRIGAFELALLQYDHPTVPEGFRSVSRGVLLNVEVDDVDAVHHQLTTQLGIEPVLPLRDEAFGQRHFIVPAPDGVLVDIIRPIPPAAEYAGAFTDAATG